MPLTRPARHRLALRPRAGLAATAALIAGLTLSAGSAYLGSGYIEPANAQSAASRTEQPTAATVDQAPDRPNASVPAPRALKTGTAVIGSEGDGRRTDPKDHLPDTMRRGG